MWLFCGRGDWCTIRSCRRFAAGIGSGTTYGVIARGTRRIAATAELYLARDGHATIDTPGDLASLLKWLATLPLTEVHIEPIGLQAVYEQYHPAEAARCGGGRMNRALFLKAVSDSKLLFAAICRVDVCVSVRVPVGVGHDQLAGV